MQDKESGKNKIRIFLPSCFPHCESFEIASGFGAKHNFTKKAAVKASYTSRVTPGIATSEAGGRASKVYAVGTRVSREFIA
jgi:hypothetical protein